MKMDDIKKLSNKELITKVSELKQELMSLKFYKPLTGIEKSHLLKSLRKDVARIMTVLNKNKREA